MNRSDKKKCYEMIRKLSDIYQSDKEYLKVCDVKLSDKGGTVLCSFLI